LEGSNTLKRFCFGFTCSLISLFIAPRSSFGLQNFSWCPSVPFFPNAATALTHECYRNFSQNGFRDITSLQSVPGSRRISVFELDSREKVRGNQSYHAHLSSNRISKFYWMKMYSIAHTSSQSRRGEVHHPDEIKIFRERKNRCKDLCLVIDLSSRWLSVTAITCSPPYSPPLLQNQRRGTNCHDDRYRCYLCKYTSNIISYKLLINVGRNVANLLHVRPGPKSNSAPLICLFSSICSSSILPNPLRWHIHH